ncbi:MAG: tetratricopeptide repeat protein [Deltaproteobacteria bacterium]|nr:tetratricopeptide repeat protein [Deltaproteobacteria bacterium]
MKAVKTNPISNTVSVVILALLAAVIYSNTLHNELTYWDDNRYITDNQRVRDISVPGILRIFDYNDIISNKADQLQEYLPMTTLAHAVVYRLQGLDPVGYHLLNISLYILSVALLYFFLCLLIEDRLLSFLSTLLFTVHPSHVESVTWVAATKDSLSFVFFIASFYLYIKYACSEWNRASCYILSLAAFLLGMLSKSLVMTLPVLLILYDICFNEKKIRILDKVPYFVISGALSVLYIHVNRVFAEGSYLTTDMGLYRRGLTVVMLLAEYLGMAVFPFSSNVYYNYTAGDLPSSIFQASALLPALLILALMAVAIVFYFKGRRVVTFTVIWFLITFAPVINIFPSSTLRADRYLFIPTVAFSLLVVWSFYRLYELNPMAKRLLPILFIAVVAILAVTSFRRNYVWRNGMTLWEDSVKKDPESPLAHLKLGDEYRHRIMPDRAMAEYASAIRLNPGYPAACVNLSGLYGTGGRTAEAIDILKKCLEKNPSPIVKLALARAYSSTGERENSEEVLKEILSKDPDNIQARQLLNGL